MSVMKRIFDSVVSLLALVLLSPILVIIIVLIRIQLGSPVLFKQQRPGLNANPFYLYKFRSMLDKRDSNGVLLPNMERLTPLGRILRKLSVDELPQLWNVLKGEMSLVGPRPLLMKYVPLYNSRQALRHRVRPGITGWAQVNGRNSISWEEKFEYDIWYVENQSLWLDIKIIFMTCKKVFKSEGINQSDTILMDDFNGNQCSSISNTSNRLLTSKKQALQNPQASLEEVRDEYSNY